MSEGEQAAEKTKSAFNGIFQGTEEIRKNINSFADDIVGGNKTHESTGFSQDAKAIGNEVNKSASTSTTESTGQAQRTT